METPFDEPYQLLLEHIQSEYVTIYTITAIFMKDYSHTEGCYWQLFKSIICLFVQVLIPCLVIYDSINSMINQNICFCPNTGSWSDRVTSSILCLFLMIYYIHVWSPFSYHILEQCGSKFDGPKPKVVGIILMLLTKELDMYMSETIFSFGAIAKVFSHCLNTFATFMVIFMTTGTLNIVVSAVSLYFINDISNCIIDDHIRDKCIYYLQKRKNNIENFEEEKITYRRYCDLFGGIFGTFFFFIVVVPLSFGVMIATFCAVLYLPLCHP